MNLVQAAQIGAYVALPQEKVIYGQGSLEQLAAELDRLGCRRAFVVTGRSLATQTPVVEKVVAILGDRHAGTYAGVRQHAPESGIREAARQAGLVQADLLISLGGGSPIDAAKAVARLLAAESGGALPPHVAIPTTLSAAEFSHVAGYTAEADQVKTGFADPASTPRLVILDPEITLHTPLWLWTSSGVRALDHAVETLYSPGYHPLNDLLALQAIVDLFACLPRCKAEPADLAARHRCQLAAWMSYFSPASVAAHKGLSHTIGKRIGATYGVPHGVTSCILLAPVMRYQAPREAARLAPVGRRLGLLAESGSDLEAALAAAEAVAALVERLELPHRLRDVHVPREAFAQVARASQVDGVPPGDILHILEQAW